jgi:hypothetical protein
LRGLTSVSFGIYGFENFYFLYSVPRTLDSLALLGTKSKKPRLSSLNRFPSLRMLSLEGQQNDIETLGELKELEDLTLRSISLPDLGCLQGLKRLRSLDIKLGGIKTFRGVEGNEQIKYLELWQIRDLRTVEVLAALSGLQNVFLQSLPHVTGFPSLSGAVALRRLVIEDLKSLNNFSGLERAPALDEFALIGGGPAQTPMQLESLLRGERPKYINAWFGSRKKNEEFERLRWQHKKLEWHCSQPFHYQ